MNVNLPVLTIRGMIDYEHDTLEKTDSLLKDLEGDVIYLTIESAGGDPTIGYRIIRLIEAKFKKIVAVVPGMAYSTATLMVLGTDEIYMRKSACLGPLDTQIEHPTDGSTVSSLEIRDSLTGLAGFISTYAEGFYETLRNEMNIGKKEAAELSMKTAAELMKPLADKLDPIYLQKASRSTMLGQKYAEELLSSRMLKRNTELAKLVCRFLTNRYYYHGYAIVMDEARELLALNVKDVKELREWGDIQQIYQSHKDNSRTGVYLDYIELKVDEPIQKSKNDDRNVKNENAKIKTGSTS